jgi:hypothetical protein
MHILEKEKFKLICFHLRKLGKRDTNEITNMQRKVKGQNKRIVFQNQKMLQGNNPGAMQLMNGSRKCGVYTQWSMTQLQ